MEVLMRLWMELIVVKSGVDSIHAYTRIKDYYYLSSRGDHRTFFLQKTRICRSFNHVLISPALSNMHYL